VRGGRDFRVSAGSSRAWVLLRSFGERTRFRNQTLLENPMANVTFSSPSLSKDVTLPTVGDPATLLALAKANKIPIPFDCQDGECASCLVEVEVLSPSTQPFNLTAKEKEILKQLGKTTKTDVKDAEAHNKAPHFRLACQYVIHDEKILVKFVGDETMPVQKRK
jgi:ferredoxin